MRLSFRQKLLLTYAAFALTLIFATFAGVSYYINSLQKSNVQEAVKLATEQAVKMVDAVQQIVAANGNKDFDDPSVRANLQVFTKINVSLNKNIVYASIVSPKGDRMIQEFGAAKDPYIEHDETQTNVSEISLPNGDKLQVAMTADPKGTADIDVPIPLGGDREAHIQMRVMQSDTFNKIEESSQRITRALIFGCILMLIFLLGIFLVLWRMFFRHLELQENNARLDRMAYVGTLASGLAHEIRNPLSSMNVNLEVIREELAEINADVAEHASELSSRVQREVLQLNSTLTSFLDFALPRKEGYSHFPLKGLIDELLDAHAEELKARHIDVNVVSPVPSATVIEADRRLMHQAIRNILLNAIQVLSTSVKKAIRIKIELLPRDMIRLSIADSGPGISVESMAKIFEVFYSTRKGGSGFGLAIARKIVEEHQGKLWAENNTESRGATFTMELPTLAPQDRAMKPSPATGIARFWGRANANEG